MAKVLANLVGTEGKVVATDINTRFLNNLNMPNIEVRQHNTYTDEIEKDKYDLAHCRALLMWLSEPEKALERMLYAVKPGGWLLAEEGDFGSTVAIDSTNPSAAVFNTTTRALLIAAEKSGPLVPFFGRRLRSLVDKIGLADFAHDGSTFIARGGDAYAQVMAMGVKAREKSYIARGIFTQEQHDTVQSLYKDPSFYWWASTVFSAWGRKPVK
jgi:SAM-dependent methyltransferase